MSQVGLNSVLERSQLPIKGQAEFLAIFVQPSYTRDANRSYGLCISLTLSSCKGDELVAEGSLSNGEKQPIVEN